ncbi:LAMI_0F03818g1_1 [Lachancea mirantina]|uniref:mRNA export factor MEX67 n=1 Tax=Lachancea mirantina TaxID=1230905 RepID=A0A1G4JXN5_9SACH|nr:LAMI_0F03818g1_1 [Lachancea mirantina]
MNGTFQVANNVGFMAQQAALQNRVKVGVRGWQNATKQDLINFVSRKTRIAICDSYVEGELVVGYVNSRQDASSLLNWNGVRFAGNALRFEIIAEGNGMSNISGIPGTSNTIQLLKSFLFRRYNVQTRMLDLGNLKNDPELMSNGLFSSTSTQSKMFPALMKLASRESQLVVESVNLSNNSLRDVNGISSLAQTFPRLKNLCLANNQISRFRSLEVWKGKFKELRELLMANNPVVTDPMYKTEILRLFPKLVVLDSILLRDEAKLQSVYSIPTKIQQFFFETNELGQSSIDFVSNFLNLWDSDRAQLMGLYTPQSQFSVSVDSSVPSSSVPNADQNPSLSFYLSLSRNLTKISSEKTKLMRLATGQEAIDRLFRSLPKTKHLLQEQPLNYSVEAWSYPQVQGFIISLHGFFDEIEKPELDANKAVSSTAGRSRRFNHSHSNTTSKLGKKSFDRTWIIVPNQGHVVIASDLLTVRPYADGSWSKPTDTLPTSTLQAMPGQPASETPAPTLTPSVASGVPTSQIQLPPEIQAKMTPLQLDILNRLHNQTKLNAEYTYMLAEQSGWNFDVAIKGFQNSVQNIPQGAFL